MFTFKILLGRDDSIPHRMGLVGNHFELGMSGVQSLRMGEGMGTKSSLEIVGEVDTGPEEALPAAPLS